MCLRRDSCNADHVRYDLISWLTPCERTVQQRTMHYSCAPFQMLFKLDSALVYYACRLSPCSTIIRRQHWTPSINHKSFGASFIIAKSRWGTLRLDNLYIQYLRIAKQCTEDWRDALIIIDLTWPVKQAAKHAKRKRHIRPKLLQWESENNTGIVLGLA